MDDPWDVKSVRQSGQYISCMKLNGVPLLPPVLSKECRKEMQYYKLLAKEVEKRICVLQPYIESDTDCSEDTTDAPFIPESEEDYQDPKEFIQTDFDVNIETNDTLTSSLLHTELYDSPNPMIKDIPKSTSPQFFVDLCLNINETAINIDNRKNNTPSPPIEIPERDYDCITSRTCEDKNVKSKQHQNKITEDVVKFSFSLDKNNFSDPFRDNLKESGTSSLTSKSFTGSLNNIHSESSRSANLVPNLVRQRSYTILNPSPQLLAHLEVQSLNLGVEMSCFSMTDSLSNISTPNKKRRSWDLESAKVKWSNMALELKQKNLSNSINKNNKDPPKGQTRAKPVATARIRRSSLSSKPTPKTEPIVKVKRNSPVRHVSSDKTIILEEPMTIRTGKEPKFAKPNEPTSPKVLKHKEPLKTTNNTKKEPQSPKSTTPHSQQMSNSVKPSAKEPKKSSAPNTQLVSDSEDPAAKVKELYEKIQKQQQVQMASLVEKQKREQMLLQQVFEEQNNLLFKQLKTICPKSPIEAKEAWVDKTQAADRGPVSLSQLINFKSPDTLNSPVSSTLTDSNKYINRCDNMLKKSRDITKSIKKQGQSQSQNGTTVQSPYQGSLTRTNSPNRKSTPTSRRLHYDTSHSERDYDPMLTDRTNDTMADLNVTFPSDSEDCRPFSGNSLNYICEKDVTVIHSSPTRSYAHSTDSAIKSMERTIQNSINSSSVRRSVVVRCQPTPREQAAASKIVAHVKGYLVRRLMKTARVQSTVQTIKDALLCALQLHQDREGIRGADVDLHRRLIQQITAACYCLHDTFITSTAGERCAMIAADRSRRASLVNRPPPHNKHRHSDIMSQSHSGVFPPRPKRISSTPASLMTQSYYESCNSEKSGRTRYMAPPRHRPWR